MAYTPCDPTGFPVAAKCAGDIHPSMMGRNPNTLGCIFGQNRATIKSAKENKKEAEPIDNELYIQHIAQMLRGWQLEPLRALYMVAQQMHRLQGL